MPHKKGHKLLTEEERRLRQAEANAKARGQSTSGSVIPTELAVARRKHELAGRERNKEGNREQAAFVREREKLAARTGISSKRAGEILGKERAEVAEIEFRLLEEKAQKEADIAKARLAEQERNKLLTDESIAEEEPRVEAQGELPEGFAGTGGVTPVTATDVVSLLPGGAFTRIGKGVKIAKGAKIGAGLSLPITEKAIINAKTKSTVIQLLKDITLKIGTKAAVYGAAAGTTVFGLSRLLGTPKRRLQTIDTAQTQIREGLSFPVEAVRFHRITPIEGIELLQEMEDKLDDYDIQLREMWLVDFTEIDAQVRDAAILRNEKIKGFIDNAQFFLQTQEVTGEIDDEGIANLIEEMRAYERGL